jgi:hypothetical protein
MDTDKKHKFTNYLSMQITVYILLADTYCPGPSSLATADIRPTTMQNYTAFMDTIAYVV